MYTLLELESKTFGALKKIGDELNVLPEGDRRYRQTWIDAIAGVSLPLLQLLEVSAASVEQVQESIVETVETSPGVEVEPVQEAPLESKFGRIVSPRSAQEAIASAAKNSPGVKVEQAQGAIVPVAKTSAEKVSSSKKVKANSYLDCPSCCIGRLRVKQSIYWETSCTKCGYFAQSTLYPFTPAVTGYKVGDWVKLRVKPRLATNICRGEVVCIDKVQDDYLRFVNPNLNPALVIWARRQLLHPHEVFPCEPPFVKAAENSPGVEVEPVQDLLPECSNCFGDGYVEDEFGRVKFCQCEPKLSRQKTQSAIAPAAKNHLEEESDLNPILTGMALSDRFLARYSPPQPEIEFNVGTDGQLNLIDFKVADEPPDPDDFESLDAFREAIARWDEKHPSTFDHCSDIPSSVHNELSSVQKEPPDPEDFDSMFAFWAPYDAWVADDSDESPRSEDNDVSSEDKLEVSLDSFCEWAPCPTGWYEPVALLEPSKVMELSPVPKSSITSDFFIPTFGRWGDRLDRGDEPPDTGIFARLPKPKPPNFPPQASQPKSAQVRISQSGIPKLSRNYPETIPKPFHRVAAGTSTQPARSPPGGDAV